ncbi:hypothetical protein A6R68_11139 [Neotoma lepida]|uniref:DCN1-like protein n=1 Tax=Neotoma lepida TaxID=56216 RepID=A0A1A6FW12_NEOLE|nr:hypothetical protein A6R68_11139 [Neotoma lepida]
MSSAFMSPIRPDKEDELGNRLCQEPTMWWVLKVWRNSVKTLVLNQKICDTTEKLRATLDYLRSSLNDTTNFKLIYRYAFDFARSPFLDIHLSDSRNVAESVQVFGTFFIFVTVVHVQYDEAIDNERRHKQSKYKVINKDQWCNVLEFSRTISLDLSNYDEDGAFEPSAPCMLGRVEEIMGFIKETSSGKPPDVTVIMTVSRKSLLVMKGTKGPRNKNNSYFKMAFVEEYGPHVEFCFPKILCEVMSSSLSAEVTSALYSPKFLLGRD